MALMMGFLFVLVAIALISLRPRSSSATAPVEQLDLFALNARYRPMLRLLDGSDFDLLNDAGDPKLLRRIRSQRREIFRSYLRGLRRDHARLCAQVRTVIVNAENDRRDLASTLFRMEMRFQFLMLSINFKLAIHAAGFGTVTAEPLVSSFEQVSLQLQSLSAAPRAV